MHGDFSRLRSGVGYSRVLVQQGRVQLDSDQNEQAALILRSVRSALADLIGPHGGPAGNLGFALTDAPPNEIKLGPGRYYVDGVLVETTGATVRIDPSQTVSSFDANPPASTATELATNSHLICLRVWERTVTALEDPGLLEPALGGPDTAARAVVNWDVECWSTGKPTLPADSNAAQGAYDVAHPSHSCALKARAITPVTPVEACTISPRSSYRGPENQLYRVEVHAVAQDGSPLIKWSRENGSVTFRVLELSASGSEATLVLSGLGRDRQTGIQEHARLELLDDRLIATGRSGQLVEVTEVRTETNSVIVKRADGDTGALMLEPGAFVRRWDHRGDSGAKGAVKATVSAGAPAQDTWLTLEEGVQVAFFGTDFRVGDYWLIPARVETGDVDWPRTGDLPDARGPDGVDYRCAVIGVRAPGGGALKDMRRKFDGLSIAV